MCSLTDQAPEVLHGIGKGGIEAVRPSNDTWALGCIAYETGA